MMIFQNSTLLSNLPVRSILMQAKDVLSPLLDLFSQYKYVATFPSHLEFITILNYFGTQLF